ncbi:MAG: DUF4124 domain-containing protein [Syntrophales bacterium]|nr:DUF4124 domain-containing protein [Syntrophales bacterium]
MRYLHIIVVITFFIALFSSPTRAGDVYMWTDEEGVVHITDNPHRLPPGDGVERIGYRNRDDADGQPFPDKGQGIETVPEGVKEKGAVSDQNGGLLEEPHRRGLERELGRAREEHAHAKELVERRRRDYSRKSTRRNRDQYRYALDRLAEKREKLRELERQE